MKFVLIRSILLAMVLLSLAGSTFSEVQAVAEPEVNTFSIVAIDPARGELGVAVESKYFSVGSVVPWARAGVGAVATQSLAKTTYGSEGLRLMEQGKAPKEALAALVAADPGSPRRQVGMIDASGRTAVFTGKECMAWAGHREGNGYCVQGNLLVSEKVLIAMAEAFEAAREIDDSELADWMMAALAAGQAAGGDRRGQQSAALLVVRDKGDVSGDNDRYIDLRVEDHPKPIAELARLLELHQKIHPPLRSR